MTIIKTTIQHEGKTYAGQIGTIKSTRLGVEDHGVMTATLNIEWSGGGIGVGGYTLDSPRKDDSGKHLGRIGTAYGLDHIMRLLETVGVDRWEQLPGKQVIVMFEGDGGWGSISCGIAGITNEKVFDVKVHVNEFLKLEEA
ncbi:hypothetical protein DM793_18565 [Paenarthrobacter nitroguajacolicus]|uniref:hypothetical protein n=1 Tax=Paenarthrobacter nitroguajacolicus TaxID=211146 RepID=UPI0015BCBFE5|nr:hypothetical protein [Paenarthrobacter nitroguajacolicus]NWL13271.1 hypothetical protein [Paenarthrobacter nitroguajacolicus]